MPPLSTATGPSTDSGTHYQLSSKGSEPTLSLTRSLNTGEINGAVRGSNTIEGYITTRKNGFFCAGVSGVGTIDTLTEVTCARQRPFLEVTQASSIFERWSTIARTGIPPLTPRLKRTYSTKDTRRRVTLGLDRARPASQRDLSLELT